MSTAINTLVVGLDFGACGERALRTALSMRRESTTIHVVHVVVDSDLLRGEVMRENERALDRLPAKMWKKVFAVLDELDLGHDEVPVSLHVRLGEPAATIKQVAVDYDADLVIVGTHGRKGLKRIVLGSVAESLVRDGQFPVLVAHANELSGLEKTQLPDAPYPEGHVIQPTRERPHVYRSTLISAWSALGRPTRTSLA